MTVLSRGDSRLGALLTVSLYGRSARCRSASSPGQPPFLYGQPCARPLPHRFGLTWPYGKQELQA